jgi:hypothetical protein
MDMNFPHRQKGQAAGSIALLGDGAPDLSILLAVASARQAASPTARFVALEEGQAKLEGDFVRALAQIFAPRRVEKVKAASLAGCFNPLIAGHLGVGPDTGEDRWEEIPGVGQES